MFSVKTRTAVISRVTDAVLDEVSDWQNRALEPMYPIVRRDIDPPDQSLILLTP